MANGVTADPEEQTLTAESPIVPSAPADQAPEPVTFERPDRLPTRADVYPQPPTHHEGERAVPLSSGEVQQRAAQRYQGKLDRWNAQQMYERQQEMYAGQQAQLKDINRQSEATFKQQGVATQRNPDTGMVEPVRDDSGNLVYHPGKGPVQYDETGKPFQEQRTTAGPKTVQLDTDAEIGTHPDRPNELYKQNKYSPWDYLGTVQEGLQSSDEGVQNAAQAAQLKLDKRLHGSVGNDLGRVVAQSALDVQAKSEDFHQNSADLKAASDALATFDQDHPGLNEKTHIFGGLTPQAQALQDQKKQLSDQVDALAGKGYSALDPDKNAADYDKAEKAFTANERKIVGEHGKDLKAWRETSPKENGDLDQMLSERQAGLVAAGKDPNDDPIFQSLEKRKAELGIGQPGQPAQDAQDAELRADPATAPLMQERDQLDADHQTASDHLDQLSAEYTKRIQPIADQLNAKQNQVAPLQAEYDTLSRRLSQIDTSTPAGAARAQTLQDRLAPITAELQQRQAELAPLQEAHSGLIDEYEKGWQSVHDQYEAQLAPRREDLQNRFNAVSDQKYQEWSGQFLKGLMQPQEGQSSYYTASPDGTVRFLPGQELAGLNQAIRDGALPQESVPMLNESLDNVSKSVFKEARSRALAEEKINSDWQSENIPKGLYHQDPQTQGMTFDRGYTAAAMISAMRDGVLSPDWVREHLDEARQADDEYQKLMAAAGSNQKLKAFIDSGIKSYIAFQGGAAASAGVAPFDPELALAGGSLTAPVGGWGAVALPALVHGIAFLGGAAITNAATKAIVNQASKYSDLVSSLESSAQLQPGYAAAGEFAGMGPAAVASFQGFAKAASIVSEREGAAAATKFIATRLASGAGAGVAFEAAIRPGFDAATHALGINPDEVHYPTFKSIAQAAAIMGILSGEGLDATFKRALGMAANANPEAADLVKDYVAKGDKHSPEFRSLFGGLPADITGTTDEKIAAFAKSLGMVWDPTNLPRYKENAPTPAAEAPVTAPAAPATGQAPVTPDTDIQNEIDNLQMEGKSPEEHTATQTVLRGLVKIAQGEPIESLTAAEKTAVLEKGPDGLPRVEVVKGTPVITNSALDRVRQIAPITAQIMPQDEESQRQAIVHPPEEPEAEEKPEPSPVAAEPTEQQPTFAVEVQNAKGETEVQEVQAATEEEAHAQVAQTIEPGQGLIRDVTKVREPGPNYVPPDKFVDHVVGQITQEAGRDLQPQEETAIRDLAGHAAPAYERWSKAFDTVRATLQARQTAGAMFHPGENALEISLPDLARQLRDIENKPEDAGKIVTEEALHSVLSQIEDRTPDGEVRGPFDFVKFYDLMPQELKDAMLKAYKASDTPYAQAHEFWRMFFHSDISLEPGRKIRLRDQVLHEQSDRAFIQGIAKPMARVLRYVRDLYGELQRKGVSDDVISAVRQGVQIARAKIKEVDAHAIEPVATPSEVEAEQVARPEPPAEARGPPTGAEAGIEPTGSGREAVRPEPTSGVGAVGETLPTGAEGTARTLEPATRAELAEKLSVPHGAIGHATEIINPSGESVPAVFVVLPSADVQTSHDWRGRVNPNYDQAYQPRDRSLAQYQKQSQNIGRDLSFDQAAYFPGTQIPATTSDLGAPGTTLDKQVIIGHGRTNGQKFAEENKLETAREYKRRLILEAANFGIDPKVVKATPNPQLHRIITADIPKEDLAKFSQESNEPVAMGTNAIETARRDASRLTPQHLSLLNPNYDLSSAKNAPFMRAYLKDVVRGQVGPNEANLTGVELSNRVRSAIFTHAYGVDEAGRAAIERLAGEADPSGKTITNGLLTVAPIVARMRADIKTGDLHPNMDIAPAVTRAAQDIATTLQNKPTAQPAKQALDALYQQRNLVEEEPLNRAVLDFLLRNRTKRRDIEQGLSNFVEAVYALGNPKQVELFTEGGVVTPLEVFKAATSDKAIARKEDQRVLAAQQLKLHLQGEIDPRLQKIFGRTFDYDSMGLPKVPETLPANHPLLTSTDRLTKVTVESGSKLDTLGILQPGIHDRAEMHIAIGRYFLQGGTLKGRGPMPEPQMVPELLMMGGGGGAGKSSSLELSRKLSGEPEGGAVTVNADDIRELIPEYSRIKATGDGRAAFVTHEEATKINDRLLELAQRRRVNIVLDGTMKTPRNALRVADAAIAAGYEVRMLGVTIDPYEAAVRASLRAHKIGRWVPHNLLFGAHKGFNSSLPDYIRKLGAKNVRVFDNSGAKTVEIPIDQILRGEYKEVDERSQINPEAKTRDELFGAVRGRSEPAIAGRVPEGRKAGRPIRRPDPQAVQLAFEVLRSQPLNDEGEKIALPAVRDSSGKVFTGRLHDEAIDKAYNQYRRNGVFPRDFASPLLEDGFTTTKGRFLGREDAFELAQKYLRIPAELEDEFVRPELETNALRDAEKTTQELKSIDAAIRTLRAQKTDSGTLDLFNDYAASLPPAAKVSKPALKEQVKKDVPALSENEEALANLFAAAAPKTPTTPQLSRQEQSQIKRIDAEIKNINRRESAAYDMMINDRGASYDKLQAEHDALLEQRREIISKATEKLVPSPAPSTPPSSDHFWNGHYWMLKATREAERLEAKPNRAKLKEAEKLKEKARGIHSILEDHSGEQYKALLREATDLFDRAEALEDEAYGRGKTLTEKAPASITKQPSEPATPTKAPRAKRAAPVGTETATGVDDLFSLMAKQHQSERDSGLAVGTGKGAIGVPGSTDVERPADISGHKTDAGRPIGSVTSGDTDGGRGLPTSPESRGPEAVERPGGKGALPKLVTRPTDPNARNYVIPRDTKEIAPRGAMAKLKANQNAIRLLKQIEGEQRLATPEEKAQLVKFSGWGALSQAFDDRKADRIANGEIDYIKGELERYREYLSGNPGSTYYQGYIDEYEKDLRSLESWRDKWGDVHAELKSMLTPEEYKRAMRSTINAHYTSPEVINSMWDIASHLGFKGGNVLEPGAGVGHFFGLMPEGLVDRSKLHAVELDDISGRLTKLLYPEADVQITGFQNADIADGSVDLAISNVPFANVPVTDKAMELAGGPVDNLHDYFLANMIKKLKPGGLNIAITSAFTMDKGAADNRRWMADRADLVAAFRLPNDAFRANAGTDVVTDILVLRKKDGQIFPHAKDWTMLDAAAMANGGTIRVNQYFAQHPNDIIGFLADDGEMFAHGAGEKEMTVHGDPNRPPGVALAQALDNLPKDVAGDGNAAEVRSSDPTISKMGNIVLQDGKYFFHGQEAPDEDLNNPKNAKRVRRFIDARDVLNEQYRLELSPEATDEDVEGNRRLLNQRYDAFVADFSNFHTPKNKSLFIDDPDWFRLAGAETPVTITGGLTGKEMLSILDGKKSREFTKADVFKKRVLTPIVEPTKADSLEDAFGMSLGWRGRVDLGYIADLTGKSREEVEQGLVASEIVVRDPETGQLLSREQYLAGNVRKKLEIAKAAGPDYERNARLLETVQPEDVPIDEIRFKIGATWVPVDAYKQYLETIGVRDLPIEYHPAVGGGRDFYTVKVRDFSAYGVGYKDFQTEHMSLPELMDAMLNMKRITVKAKDENKKVYVDEVATMTARDAAKRLSDAFVAYAKSQPELGERLAGIYNREVNGFAQRTYNGQFLTLPWVSKDFDIFPDKKNVIWRAIQDGRALIAWGVGGGKTVIATGIALEMRRLGLARKPMMVVHNSTLEQYATEIANIAPSARVLIGRKDELQGAKRKEFLMRIAAGDWDAVVIAHSTFGLIEDDPVFQQKHMESLVDEAMHNLGERGFDSIDSAKSSREPSVKQLVKMIEKLEGKLAALSERKTDTGLLNFQQLGVDALIVDEVHAFKKMPFSTKLDVKGIDSGMSDRGYAMLLRARSIQERNGGKNVFSMTGTPVTNTLGEIWNQVRLVAPDLLKEYGVETFDQFVSKFAEVETISEAKPSGERVMVERLSKIVNLPEWSTFFRQAADVKLGDDMVVKNRPGIKGGGGQLIALDRTPGAAGWVNYIRQVLEGFKGLRYDDFKENKGLTAIPVQAYVASRAAAIDIRLVEPRAKDELGSKANRAVRGIIKLYRESTPYRGTQVIFSDSFNQVKTSLFDYVNPRSNLKVELDPSKEPGTTFNLYDDIKAKLIRAGVPAEEITIVSDKEFDNAKRKKLLFEKINQGKVRIVMGSTEKLGTGVNMQERMLAAWNLDVPWTAAGLEQRDGRVYRQGNVHAEMGVPVELNRLGMKDTLDESLWRIIERKLRIQKQALSGKIVGRELEEMSDVLSLAEQAAILSGPYGAESFELDQRIRELYASRIGHDRQVANRDQEIRDAKLYLSQNEAENTRSEPSMQLMTKLGDRIAKDGAQITVDGDSFKTKTAMVERIDALLNAEKEKPSDQKSPAILSIVVNGVPIRLKVTPTEYDQYEGEGEDMKLVTKPSANFNLHSTDADSPGYGRVTSAATLLARLEELSGTVQGIREGRKNNMARLKQLSEMKQLGAWPYEEEYQNALVRQKELLRLMRGEEAKPAVTGEPNASTITSTEGVGVRGEGEGVGGETSLRQQGETAQIQEGIGSGELAAQSTKVVEITKSQSAQVAHGRGSDNYRVPARYDININGVLRGKLWGRKQGYMEKASWEVASINPDNTGIRTVRSFDSKQKAIDWINQNPHKFVTDAAERPEELKAQALTDSSKTIRERFEENLPLANRIAGSFSNIPGVERGDIQSRAKTALLRASRAFDASRGIPFKRLAYVSIENELKRFYGQQTGLRETTTLDETLESGITRKDLLKAPTDVRAEVARDEASRVLTETISELPARMQETLGRVLDGQTFPEIAKAMGVSKQGAQQLAVAAMKRLKPKFAERGIQGSHDLLSQVINDSVKEADTDDPMGALMDLLKNDPLKQIRGFAKGRPDLALGTIGPEMEAVHEFHTETATPQKFEQWEKQADQIIAKRGKAWGGDIVKRWTDGGFLEPSEVRATQKYLIAHQSEAKTPAEQREYDAAAYAYTKIGEAVARQMASRRDPFKTPEERNRDFLAKAISFVNRGEQAELDSIKDKAKRVARLQDMIAERRRQIGLSLEYLTGKGVTLDDILSGGTELRLVGAKIIENQMKDYGDAQKKALRLAQKGEKSAEEIAKLTGLSAKQVRDLNDERNSDIRKQLMEKALRGATAENLDPMLLAQPTEGAQTISKEAAEAEVRKMMRAMGLVDSKDLGKMKVTRRRSKPRIFVPPPVTGPPVEPPAPGELPTGQERQAPLIKPAPPTGTPPAPGAVPYPQPSVAPYTGRVLGQPGLPLYQELMIRKGADLSSPTDVATLGRIIGAAANGNRFDMLYEAWLANILSGPTTHLSYKLALAANLGLEISLQRGVESLVNLAVRDPKSAQVGEFPYIIKGLTGAMTRAIGLGVRQFGSESELLADEVLNQQVEAFGTGPGSKFYTPAISERPLSQLTAAGNKTAFARGLTATGEALDNQLAKLGPFNPVRGRVLRMPLRVLMFVQGFYAQLSHDLNVGAFAYRQAKAEGLTGDKLSNRINELVATPGSDPHQKAVDFAEQMTFRQPIKTREQGGNAIENLVAQFMRARSGSHLLGTQMPFVELPFNLFRIGLRKSPFGAANLLSRVTEAGFFKMKDGKPFFESYPKADFVKHVAEQLIAWTLASILWNLAWGDDDDGDKPIVVTGGMPTSTDMADMRKSVRELYERAYGGPTQIIIGGRNGAHFNYGKYEPVATVLGTVVNTIHQLKHLARGEQGVGDTLSGIWAYSVAQAEEKTFLRGLSKMLDSIRHPSQAGGNIKELLFSALVPNLIRQPLRNIDDYIRDYRTASPLYSSLPTGALAQPKIDVYGKPVQKQGNWFTRMFVQAGVRPDPVLEKADQLTLRYNLHHPQTPYAPSVPLKKYKDAKGKDVDMTPEQGTKFQVNVGKRFSTLLRGQISQAQVNKPTEEDIKLIKELHTRAMEQVKREMFPKGQPPKQANVVRDWLKAA